MYPSADVSEIDTTLLFFLACAQYGKRLHDYLDASPLNWWSIFRGSVHVDGRREDVLYLSIRASFYGPAFAAADGEPIVVDMQAYEFVRNENYG